MDPSAGSESMTRATILRGSDLPPDWPADAPRSERDRPGRMVAARYHRPEAARSVPRASGKGSSERLALRTRCRAFPGKESPVPQYVTLVNWTDQGLRQVKDAVARAEQVKQVVAQMGGNMHTVLWTQGRYDIVGVFEAPD